MKKENIYKFLYLISILLLIGFAIRFGMDCFKYNSDKTINIYLLAVERVFEFVLPSIIIFVVAKFLKKKH